MATTLKEGADEGDNTWSEFALVARDLVGEGLLDGINFPYPIPFASESSFDTVYQFTRSERLLQ
jgi:hypothetical protein